MKLTKRSVESLPIPKSGQNFVWDSELTGFGVRLNPAGRTYILQARVNGVSRRVSLGRHGVITAEEARKKAQKQLGKMLDGKDPAIEKKRVEAFSLTLRQLADKYIEAHHDLKPSSIAGINKHVNRSFFAWTDRPAIEITRDKVATRFRELTERSAAQANQAFRILRALLNYARVAYRSDNRPMFLENPVSIISDAKLWNHVRPRSARIPTDKVGIVWNTLQALRKTPEQTRISRTLADVVSFLILTGARLGEATQLTWDRVNLEEGWWYLPDPKNRNPVKFPLSRLAREILEGRPGENQYVFPTRSGGSHVSQAFGVLEMVSQAAGDHLTAQDMRRTFRAIAGECGIELWRTKLLMNHKLSGDVTINSYTEASDLTYLSPEINKIAAWIERQALIAASEKVVQLNTQKTA